MHSIIPRVSDFNRQGVIKSSIHFDYVCEAQKAKMIALQFPFAQCQELGLDWMIADYSISFQDQHRDFSPVSVAIEFIPSKEDFLLSSHFSFFHNGEVYAKGTISFELQTKGTFSKQPIPQSWIDCLNRQL